jgi:uncharacterized membrane protein
MFSLFRKHKPFFAEEENASIIEAVRQAEQRTSGEVRIFIETHCRYVDAIDRAAEIFVQLKMSETKDRNAVLLYIALKDRQLAIFGDEGIHQKVGESYWQEKVRHMVHAFNRNNYAEGIRRTVLEIGEALCIHFPYQSDTDKNELPDDIVFGK